MAPSNRIAAGSRSHELLEAIKKVPGTEIAGVCDAYSGRVERAIERTGSRARDSGSYERILSDPSIDAVMIGTTDHWHKRMVLKALQAGKNVYCGKPLTFAIDEGREIAAAAEKSGKILQGRQPEHQQRKHEEAAKLGAARKARASLLDPCRLQPTSMRRKSRE